MPKSKLKRGARLGNVVADDAEPTVEELLAQFRLQREQRAAEAGRPVLPQDPLHLSPPMPGPVHVASPLPVSAPRRLEPASAPGRSLAAAGPVLKLSAQLLRDAQVTVRGSRWGRRIGLAMVCIGVLGLAVERRMAIDAGASYTTQIGLPLWSMPVTLALLGIVVFALGCVLPRARRLAVRMAASQREEWERIQQEARVVRAFGIVAATLLVVGPLLVAGAYGILPYGLPRLAALGLGGLAIVLGLVLAGIVAVRRAAVQRLYVQTLVLARLEASGLGIGGTDGRVGPVLRTLDQLLGAVPEAAVRQFLASPAAQDYLDLIEESGEESHG